MKTMFLKSVAVLLFSFALIQTTDAHDRDFRRDKDRRYDRRDDDRRYYHHEHYRYFAYGPEYRRDFDRERPHGHYIIDRCGREVFVRDCR